MGLEQTWWRSCAVMSGLRVSAPSYVIQVSSIYMHLQVSLVHWDHLVEEQSAAKSLIPMRAAIYHGAV